jgi:hypothetical protein
MLFIPLLVVRARQTGRRPFYASHFGPAFEMATPNFKNDRRTGRQQGGLRIENIKSTQW